MKNMVLELAERAIEAQAERFMDKLDEQLMKGQLSQEQYDEEVRNLDRIVEGEYRRIRENADKIYGATTNKS